MPPIKTHCKNGHERTPDNILTNKGCKICSREQERKRRADGIVPKRTHCSRDHALTPANTNRRGDCKICEAERNRRKYLNNLEKIRTRQVGFYQRNKEKLKKASSEYRLNNPELTKKATIEWIKLNPEKMKKTYRKHGLKRVATLEKSYVAKLLGLSVQQATPELLEMKRNRLLEIRALKALKNALGGK